MGFSKHSALALLLALSSAATALAGCPFGFDKANAGQRALVGAVGSGEHAPGRQLTQVASFSEAAVKGINWRAVKADLAKLVTSSQAFWPADFGECKDGKCTGGSYGGLFIRLAWHCSGSYRGWDGRGGCEGGHIRFTPEGAWPDNTNLDKAIKLLAPIKRKYGAGLSWGDLIVLSGDVAISSQGGPILGFCAGRIDSPDGTASIPLGPNEQQKLIAPCTPGDGNCANPMGATTMGLIYVNPEGPMAKPIPERSAPQIREVFARMGMNDSETVALIGGGHAFGKTHGPCPTGAGPDPLMSPLNPWPGTCGSGPLKGRGPNAFTSGFEGAWTTTPTAWSNQYFRNLLEFDWEVHKGPGGHFQWRPKLKPGSRRTRLPAIIMLTADVALLKDPKYLALVKLFAADQKALDTAFKHAWYKLTTRDMGPAVRCLGPEVPPPQPFQRPLAAARRPLPDFRAVAADITSLLSKAPDAAAALSTLAYQCAATYRDTDRSGGCNGARIRFSPEKDWPGNQGLGAVLALLGPIKAKYPNLSWADLIVLAGNTALGRASGKASLFPFCGGRSDAADGSGSAELAPRKYVNGAKIAVPDNWAVAGLTPREGVALAGRPRPAALAQAQGYSGTWDTTPAKMDNTYYKLLLNTAWRGAKAPSGGAEYASPTSGLVMTAEDLVIKNTPALAAIAREYALDNGKWLADFGRAWNKLMTADRFTGPAANACRNAALALPGRTGV